MSVSLTDSVHSLTSNKRRTIRSRSSKRATATETNEEPLIESDGLKKTRKKPSSKCNGDGVSYKRVCWGCLMNRALDSGSFINLLCLGVEFRRSSFLAELNLEKIAKDVRQSCAREHISLSGNYLQKMKEKGLGPNPKAKSQKGNAKQATKENPLYGVPLQIGLSTLL